ncbi:hypothetical protein AA14337_1514 [Acetobacter malorum DSM 14337]|uniref:Uncharacterized protein n=1 Tax=Acetobacter malorum DSM 14337 TaxID=1307910 RepID=A0ABQ0PSH3_9PROT|nr:hypothetical protein AA14337_1514 [Acetobacter malorum DSM 14337]
MVVLPGKGQHMGHGLWLRCVAEERIGVQKHRPQTSGKGDSSSMTEGKSDHNTAWEYIVAKV